MYGGFSLLPHSCCDLKGTPKNRLETLTLFQIFQTKICNLLAYFRLYKMYTWENSRHCATPPVNFPRNNFWVTSAKIPDWWRVTTQIYCRNQSGALSRPGSDTSSVWNSTLPRTSFGGKTTGGVANVECRCECECRLYSHLESQKPSPLYCLHTNLESVMEYYLIILPMLT